MDKVIIIILIFLAAKVFGKSGKKKTGNANGPARKQRPTAAPAPALGVPGAGNLGKMIENIPREPECGLPHESIPDEVHEGLDPCHDGHETVPVKTVEPIPEAQSLCGLTLSDAARGIVMAEVLGRPGGRWANRRK